MWLLTEISGKLLPFVDSCRLVVPPSTPMLTEPPPVTLEMDWWTWSWKKIILSLNIQYQNSMKFSIFHKKEDNQVWEKKLTDLGRFGNIAIFGGAVSRRHSSGGGLWFWGGCVLSGRDHALGLRPIYPHL